MCYNSLGQKVRTFGLGSVSAGYHTFEWNGRNDQGENVGAGIYFYQLQTREFTRTRKMILMKWWYRKGNIGYT